MQKTYMITAKTVYKTNCPKKSVTIANQHAVSTTKKICHHSYTHLFTLCPFKACKAWIMYRLQGVFNLVILNFPNIRFVPNSQNSQNSTWLHVSYKHAYTLFQCQSWQSAESFSRAAEPRNESRKKKSSGHLSAEDPPGCTDRHRHQIWLGGWSLPNIIHYLKLGDGIGLKVSDLLGSIQSENAQL
jgi:hypothetical protein